MMENNLTTRDIGTKSGLITGLILVVYSLLIQLLGMGSNQMMGWISYIFIIGIMFWSNKQFKDSNNDYMSLGEGFKIGMWISLFAGVFSSTFLFMYLVFVDNSMLATIKEQQIVEFEKQGMTDAQIDQALEMAEMFTSPEMMFVFGIIGTLAMGAIISLILSAIMKNEKPVFE